MQPEYVPIVAALSGALIGGLISAIGGFFANRSLKDREWRLALTKDRIATRQKLYAEFLGEAQKLILQAIDEKHAKLSAFDTVSNKFTEIELVGSTSTIEAAKRLVDYVYSTHVSDEEAEPTSVAQKSIELTFFEAKLAFIQSAKSELLALERT